MAEPASGDGAATAPESTPPPEGATPDDGLTEEQRAVAEASEKPDVVRATLTTLSREKRELERRAVKAEAELRKHEDAQRTELERATTRAEEAEQRATAAEHAALVARIATAHQLPPELASRLQGDSEEELTADAKVLARLRPASTETDLGSGVRTGTPATGSRGFSDVIRQRAKR